MLRALISVRLKFEALTKALNSQSGPLAEAPGNLLEWLGRDGCIAAKPAKPPGVSCRCQAGVASSQHLTHPGTLLASLELKFHHEYKTTGTPYLLNK